MFETLQQLDQQLLLTLNGLHSPYWDQFMWFVSAKLTWTPMYAALLFVIYKNFNLRMTCFMVIAIVLTIVYADQVCASVIRPLVERMRPSNPNNPLSEFIHIVNGKRGGRYGFPSCHAANSFGLAFMVLFLFRQWKLSLFFLGWAILNSYSRIYLGVHYPGDLLGGLLVGLSGAALLYNLFRYTLRQKTIATFLQYDLNQQNRIEKHQIESHRCLPIYVGLAVIGGIAIYAFISSCYIQLC